MINRRTLKCRACDSKIITRTQVGHRDSQTHSFACPKCGVRLSYAMDLDQRKAKISYRQPRNADWVDDEEGAIAELMFSDEIPVPVTGGEFSPFMATIWNFKDRDEYARAEQLRQQFTRVDFDYVERCVTHFERGNWDLFDKESPPDGPREATPRALDEFEGFTNATKRDFFVKLAIGDLFTDVLDTKLRNGIGHHSAHYEADTDEVVLYDTKQGAMVERRIRYTDFCDQVLRLFAAFELAAMYHHCLHIQADGRLG